MNQVSTVGLDLAKYIFQLHGADSAGAVVFRKKLRRGQLLAFLATLPPCTVAMGACASAHYWGREIAKLGHTVKLIAPAYVKPFVKRHKNDMADAEAIGTVNLIGSGRDKAHKGRSHEGLCPSGHAGDRGPGLEGLGPGGSILGGREVIAAEVEQVVDLIVRGEKALGLTR